MYHIYTDGACRSNPSEEGSWAYIILADNHSTIVAQYGEKAKGETTNNQMELSAAIHALEYCNEHKLLPAIIYSDSNYLISGITKWIHSWKLKKYHGVANMQLWLKLDSLNSYNIGWQWIKAHSGNKYNELVDKLCNNILDSK